MAQSAITSIDARAELNRLLAKKGQFRKQRTVSREVLDCHDGCCGHECAADCTHCTKKQQDFVETYTDALRVGDVRAVVVGDLNVDTHFDLLPDQFHVHTLDVINCSPDQPQGLQKTLAVTVQASTQVQMARTVTNTNTIQSSLKYTYEKVGEAGLQLTGTETVTLTTQTTQSWSKSVAQTEQVTVNAPAHTHSIATMQVIEGGAQSKFHGKVRLDGPVDANLDGFTMASQLLTDSEREVEVEGTLSVTDASQSRVIRADAPVNDQFCKSQPLFTSTASQTTQAHGVQSH